MRREVINTLTTGLSTSKLYRETLKSATSLEIRSAVSMMYGKTGKKTRIAACDREIKLRGAKNDTER